MGKNIFSVADKIVCITGSSRGLGKSLARGFAKDGAKVIISSFNEDDPYQRRVINFTPMGRRGAREEFLGAYIFLASDAASFVTGEVIYVDGGYHAA